MAILSKLVSGLASVVTNKALYVAGIIVLTLAKPACEYTVKLILRDTSVALANTESSIENTIRVAFEEHGKITTESSIENAIKEAFAENQKIIQEYVCNKINEVNQFTMNEIEGLNAQISIIMNELKTNQSTILNKNNSDTLCMSDDIVNRIQSNNVKAFAEMQMQLPDKDYIESTAKKYAMYLHDEHKDDIVNRIQNNNVKAFAEMQMQLPDKDYIESTAKKYAMYLHDEHVEIMNLTRDDDTISIASTRAESVQAIPTPKEVPVPRLGPIKFAPPPISGVPKLRKPLSARSVN